MFHLSRSWLTGIIDIPIQTILLRFPANATLTRQRASANSVRCQLLLVAFQVMCMLVLASDSRAAEAESAPSRSRRVVESYPPNGAVDVPLDTQIRLRFDGPMDPYGAKLEWSDKLSGGFRPRGQLEYLEEKHELVLPVRLAPGCTHTLIANELPFYKLDPEGFLGTDGCLAKPYTWSFTTRQLPTTPADRRPKVIAVDPPSNSETALLTLLRARFDRPMDPSWYGLSLQPWLGVSVANVPQLCHLVEYDAERFEFLLLLRLRTKWHGALQLVHFCSQNGIEAEPITLNYRTLSEPCSESLRRRVDQAGKSAQLITLMRRIRAARSQLTSVSERVRHLIVMGLQPAWLSRYSCRPFFFKMQGKRQFLANIDRLAGAFRVGSDGTTCWNRHDDKLVICPAADIAEKNVLFCDPFAVTSRADVTQLIRYLKLEYLGDSMLWGRPCHRVRSWKITPPRHSNTVGDICDWYIDAQSLLPLRLERNGVPCTDYHYDSINEPIPVEQFRPQWNAKLRPAGLRPLNRHYTWRFLNVMDGSNGHMACSWGRKGPRRTASGGLN